MNSHAVSDSSYDHNHRTLFSLPNDAYVVVMPQFFQLSRGKFRFYAQFNTVEHVMHEEVDFIYFHNQKLVYNSEECIAVVE
ncbi:hypothetical protein T10_11680 [Trichinella papuae]|uniref:Uncharacterized protein n=1 Tax=Trichinella papuae TaxID=268474 RepID=A0A0V1MVW6_9BILA|nr:hypothetical protein T10_11680 [Trichinella papuae]